MIVILGAGLTGLSTGYHLAQGGRSDFALYEKEARPLGLVRSHQEGRFTFDYTGHFLHLRDPAIRSLAAQWMGERLPEVSRSSWIHSHGVYTRYPFQTNTFGLPVEVVKECVLGYIEARYGKVELPGEPVEGHGLPVPRNSFERWIYRAFGTGIARHFMIPYNDKLWGIHPRYMSAEWMGRFVPPAPVEAVIEGALTGETANVGYNASFRYPTAGGIESFGRELAARAGTIHLEQEALEIDTRRRRVTFVSGQKADYESLVSTLPLPELCRRLRPLPSSIAAAAARLRWSSVFAVNLGVSRDLTEGRHWVYVPERKYGFYRIGCFSNAARSMAPENHASIWAEYSYNAHRPLDRNKAREDAVDGLRRMGWLQSAGDIDAEWLLDIPYAYVTFDANHARATRAIHRYLARHGIVSTGRYGNWEYSSMEDAILHGRNAASRLLGGETTAPVSGGDLK